MIDVGGAALLGAAARNCCRGRRGRRPDPLPAAHPRAHASAARCRPSSGRSWRPRRSGSSPPTTPRSRPTSTRSRGRRSRSRLAMVLEKVEDLRYGENPHQRAAFYRETTHRSGTLADAKPGPGQPADRSTTCSTSTRPTGWRTTSPRRRSRSSSTPTRSDWPRTTSSSRPTARRSRRTRWPPSAGSSGSTASSTGRPPGRSRRTRYEAVVAPGYSEAALAILRGKTGLEILAVPADPSEGMRDYGIANLDFKRVERRPARRDPGRARDRGRPPPGGHRAAPDARGADRPAVRLADRPPRPLERDRAGQERRHGGHRGRPGQPPGVGRDRPAPGGRPVADRA